jgi:DNA-binding PadR family transcriptional regulator
MGDLEELLLLAAGALGPNAAYGAALQRALKSECGRGVTLGAIYITLQRLEAKGLLSSFEGMATETRGGRRKRLYRLTEAGVRALATSEGARQALRLRAAHSQ